MTHETDHLISRYFDLAVPSTADDLEAYVALFAADAVVHDDGHTHRGHAEIRAWRSDVPDVTYALASTEPTDTGLLATAEIAGDFPGSPVTLGFAFEHDAAGLITTLTIAP